MSETDEQSDPAVILVVDDEEANRELLQVWLEEAGYQVAHAPTGAGALEFIQKNSVDLVLLDVMMPEMNGYEVCKEIKSSEGLGFIPVVLVTVLRDVTSRIQANESHADDFLSKPVHHKELMTRVSSLLRLKQTHEQLVLANRQVSLQNKEMHDLQTMKEELAQLLVHDLQNPLATISGYIEALFQGKERLTSMQRQFLMGALDGCRELREMVLNLLDISVIEASHLELETEYLALHDLADKVARTSIAPISDATLNFKNELSDELYVYADKHLVKRVFSNLIGNAVRFSPDGGTIRATAEIQKDSVICSVVDDGPGVPKEYHKKIFEKFVRLDWKKVKGRSGRGLGLAFCKLAVEAHGGQIWVDPAEKSGSQFCFSLPVSEAESASASQSGRIS
ncbi:MAG: hybrid sensor histidine kinase/response regulator [Planctomycetota bacterium]|nr:hybrid sensor histidine kinase/response regulator [Planctomycetota bacterium]MDP7254527.1 hybrid sensor histidine kinase/response regulator [Planctomycetota bacterium]